MLKQHITHLILDMIGDGKRDYKLDDGNIITAVTMPYIREKVKELTDTIVNMIVEKIRNEITDIYINADQRSAAIRRAGI